MIQHWDGLWWIEFGLIATGVASAIAVIAALRWMSRLDSDGDQGE